MPLIRTDYNPELFTSGMIRDYKGRLLERVAERLGKKIADISVFSAAYESVDDSVMAAEVLAQIGKGLAEKRYPFRDRDMSGSIAPTGLEAVEHSLLVATREFKIEHGVEQGILVATQVCDWQVRVA